VNDSPSAVAELEPCPQCASMIPTDPLYPRWCEQCGWNLQIDSAAPEDLFTKLVARVSRRKSPALHQRMMRLSPGDDPRRGKAALASYVLATTVYLPFVVLTGCGLFLIIGQWFDLFSLMLGLVFALSGLALIPRFSRLPDAGLLYPGDAPELFGLVHRLYDDAGGKPIDTIVVDTSYNAWSGRTGWRQRRAVGLGLPLVSVLEPQEFVALLSHEVGHSVNGDALRGAYIGNALDISLQSYWAFRHGSRGALRVASRTVSLVPWSVALGLVTLQFSSSQEAEYRADSVASGMAGSTALVGLLRKVILQTSYETAYFRSGGSLTALIDDLRVRVKSVPDREIDRQLRVTELPGARLDRTHPPTAWRIEFAKQRGAKPRIALDQRTFAAIVGELQSVEAATPLAYRQRRQRGL
jgi:Zn-dependent protease with chaperone function